jgi:hypothetical protein
VTVDSLRAQKATANYKKQTQELKKQSRLKPSLWNKIITYSQINLQEASILSKHHSHDIHRENPEGSNTYAL